MGLSDRSVENLESGDRESGSLTSTGLGLSDDVAALETLDIKEENACYLDDLLDGSLLDGRRFLKAISVDTSQEVLSDAHGVEGWDNIDLFRGLELDLLELIIKRLACTGTHSER